ncbi:LOW QUALITY PROTEIN: cysteine-rich repeat secretory protein 38-like [Lotus japonicus]|uniref:LOW QUALITY PROTEIN: cysteine-rich repeat secretory protein 38-like n=1 Tax=Lotus japonicus TaxID=34305 RepID=UPI002586AE5D|nr:LOW QUALITY PROTEIN: cysteine-rich repeat secretory protein 38-like [Lotus japonicus]
MASSKPFTVVLLALFLQTCFATDPLFHFCSNSGENFTTQSPYESNLKTLINSLIYKTPSTGFGVASAGQPQAQQQVNGLALCRGDASASECKTCVSESATEIRNRCPYNKGAIIWYDNCLFKYSDTDFFGKIDTANRFYMWNLKNVSDPETFNYKTKGLLSELAGKASSNPKLYATGEMELEKSVKLYGLTQCTRDLSSGDCKKCLDDAINELPNCCDGKEGGRVVGEAATLDMRYTHLSMNEYSNVVGCV